MYYVIGKLFIAHEICRKYIQFDAETIYMYSYNLTRWEGNCLLKSKLYINMQTHYLKKQMWKAFTSMDLEQRGIMAKLPSPVPRSTKLGGLEAALGWAGPSDFLACQAPLRETYWSWIGDNCQFPGGAEFSFFMCVPWELQLELSTGQTFLLRLPWGTPGRRQDLSALLWVKYPATDLAW